MTVQLPPALHEVKCMDQHFDAIERGDKGAELRFNDRNYRERDFITLVRCQRTAAGVMPTGAALLVRITHLLSDHPGLTPGYVMASFEKLAWYQPAPAKP